MALTGDMAKRSQRLATPAIAALAAAGIEFRLHEYAHDPAVASYGDEAVAALGADPSAVFKTLVITDGSRFGVAMVPVPTRLALKAAGAALGLHRPTMADPADVTRLTGYVLGGVSPVGQRRRLPTVLDDTALALPTVFCSAGRRGLEIELAPADLVAATDAITAVIATS